MNKTIAAVLAFIAIAAFAALVAIIGIGCAAFDGHLPNTELAMDAGGDR